MSEPCAHYWVPRLFNVFATVTKSAAAPIHAVSSFRTDECSSCGTRKLSDDEIVREALRLTDEDALADIRIEKRPQSPTV